MGKKSEVMRNNPSLFREYQKVLQRAKHLRAAVFLGEDAIALALFEDASSKRRYHEKMKYGDYYGLQNVHNYDEYNKESLMSINNILNTRAEVMKRDWVDEYAKLDKLSVDAYVDNVEIDLTDPDYAQVAIYANGKVIYQFASDWNYEALVKTATLISDLSDPDYLISHLGQLVVLP